MRVPVYQPQAGAPSLRRLPRENPEAAAAPYRAMADLARTVARIGVAEVERATRIRNETWLTETLSTARARAYAEYDEAKRAAPEGAPNFRAERAQAVESLAEALLKDAPDEETALALRQGLAALRFDIERDATAFESAAAAAAARSRYERARDTDANLLLSHPEQYETVRRQREAARAALAGVLPADAVAALAAEDESLLAGAMVSGLIDQDPAAALRLLDGGQLDARLAPEQKGRLMGAAQIASRRREGEAAQARAIADAEYLAGLDDYLAWLEAGNADDGRYARADLVARFGQERGSALAERVEAAAAFGPVMALVRLAGPDDLQDLGSSAPFREVGPAATLFAQAVELRDRAVAADPAGYVLANAPLVREAYALMDHGEGEGRAVAARRYVVAMRAEQERLGLGIDRRRLLPGAAVARIAEAFAGVLPGDEETVRLALDLRAQWGEHWPQAAWELGGSIPPIALVFASGMPRAAALKLAAAMRIGRAELERRVLPQESQEIGEHVTRALLPFRESLTPPADQGPAYAVWHRAAVALAQLEVAEGASAPEAAVRAAGHVVLDRYRFRGGLRVPRRRDPDLVEAGLRAYVDRLGPADIAVPPEGVRRDGYRTAGAVLAALKAEAGWLARTWRDETGALLAESDGTPVWRAASGRRRPEPLVVPWDDLEALGRAAPARDGPTARPGAVPPATEQ